MGHIYGNYSMSDFFISRFFVLLISLIVFSSDASALNLNVGGVDITSSSKLLTFAGNAGPYWRPTVRDTNFMEWTGTRYIHFETGVTGSFFMASPNAPSGSKLDLFRMVNLGSGNYSSVKMGSVSVPDDSRAYYLSPGEYVVRATMGHMETPHVLFDFFPDNDTGQVIDLNPKKPDSAMLSWMPAYYKKEVESWIERAFDNAALRIGAIDQLVFQKKESARMLDDFVDAVRLRLAMDSYDGITVASILMKKAGQAICSSSDPDGDSTVWNLYDNTIQHLLVIPDIIQVMAGDWKGLPGIGKQIYSDATSVGISIGGMSAIDYHFEKATEAFLARLLLESFLYMNKGSLDKFSIEYLNRPDGTFEEICAAAAVLHDLPNTFFDTKYEVENVYNYFDIAVGGITNWLPIRQKMRNPYL